MQILNVLHAAHWKYRMQKKSPKLAIYAPSHSNEGTHRQSEKNLLNSNISPTCAHNMVNFGPLAPEIILLVWGTPANFNGFRVLAELLQWRRSTEAMETLHNVWPSPGLVHYIYIFGGSCPVTEFCQVQNSLCVQVLALSYIGSITAGHSSSGRQPNFAVLSRGCHYIFDRADITLGSGPHSSICYRLH